MKNEQNKLQITKKETLKIRNIKQKNTIKGITLIALVITIIVLLILAGVSIATLTGQDNLMENAAKARDNTNEATEDEKVKLAVASARIAGEGKLSTENIKNAIGEQFGTEKKDNLTGTDEGPWTFEGDIKSYNIDKEGSVTEKVIADRTGIEVGDYIDYKPDESESYSSTELGEAKTGNNNNRDITQDTLTWQVLRKYEDGSLDIIGSPSVTSVSFYGATGYNNGVDIINDICEKLYSKKSEGITARSVNIEDFEYWLTDEGNKIRDDYVSNGGVQYGQTSKKYSYYFGQYPNLYQYEKGAGIGTTEVKKDGLGVSDKISKLTKNQQEALSNNSGNGQVNELTVTETLYWTAKVDETNFGEGAKVLKTTKFYWLASRYAENYGNYARFGIRCAGSGLSSCGFFYSQRRKVLSE